MSLGLHRRHGLAATYAAALAVLLLLHPVCRAYRRLKRRYPDGPLRLL